jgi:hypothetical protein
MGRPRGSIRRSVGIEFDDSEFLGSLEEAVEEFHHDGQRAIETTANVAASEMRRRLARDRELASSISVAKGADYVEVGTSHFRALFTEYGTGVFGKTHRPIVPRRKKVLAGGLGHPVEQVAGMRPKPFFRPALNLAIRRFKAAFK